MRKRLKVGLGVAGVVVLLGAMAYAAWTQGEAAYARGYTAAQKDERASDRPKLTADIVRGLVTSRRPDVGTSICELSVSYMGGGLWVVETSTNPQEAEARKRQYANALTERSSREAARVAQEAAQMESVKREAYEQARQRFIYLESERVRIGKIIYGDGVLEREADRVAQEAVSKVTLPRPTSPLPMPPYPTLNCRSVTFAVSELTGNVTGP